MVAKPNKKPSTTSYDKRGNRVSSSSPSAVSSGTIAGGARNATPMSSGSGRSSSSVGSSALGVQAPAVPSPSSRTTASGGQPKPPTISPARPSSGSTYSGGSVVDYLGSTGQDSSYGARSKAAQAAGIQNYTGTAAQNTALLSSLRGNTASNPSAGTATDSSIRGGAPSFSSGSVDGQDFNVSGNASVDERNRQKAAEIAAKKARSKQDAAQQKSYDRGALNPDGPDISNPGLIQQLLAARQKLGQDIQPKWDALTSLRSRNAQQVANTLGSAGDESLQTGRAAIYQSLAAQQERVRQEEIDNILAGTAQQSSMLGTAIGATQPVMQFGQLTNPQTGAVLGAIPGNANPLLTQAVQNALAIVSSGGSYQDALSSLSAFGAMGEQALITALRATTGQVNPTLMNVRANVNAGQQTAGGNAMIGSLEEANRTVQMVDNVGRQYNDEVTSLKSFASNGALSNKAGIVSEAIRAWENTAGGSVQVPAFLQKAASVGSLYTQLTGQPSPLDQKLTVDQFFKQLDAMTSTIASRYDAAKRFIASPSATSSSSSGNPASSSGGGLYDF